MNEMLICPEWLSVAAEDMAAFAGEYESSPMTVTRDGVAVINIHGPMSKGGGWFGFGTSTIGVRNQIADAVAMDDVRSIMLHIDSPGGTVAGTMELAEDIRQADEVKPVYAHIDDMGASAALWAGSQVRSLTANKMAQVGSIGVVAVLADYSAKAEKQGIKFHVVSTGRYKGAGTPGTPITEEHLDFVQERVDQINEMFIGSLASGRGMDDKAVRALADGRTWIAGEAQANGLIDEVMDFRSAVEKASMPDQSTQRRDGVAARIRASRLK